MCEKPYTMPITETDWFKGSLAKAAVMWIDGVGLCSHQPDLKNPLPKGQYRMINIRGNFSIVPTARIYEIELEMKKLYWNEAYWVDWENTYEPLWREDEWIANGSVD